MAKKKIIKGATAPLTEKVAEFFANNPKAPQVYTTADDYLFENKKFAYDHARTLGDAEPELINNPLAAFEPDDTEDSDTEE